MFFISDNLESEDRYGLQKFLSYTLSDKTEEKIGLFTTLDSVFLSEMRELPVQSYVTCKGEHPDLMAYKIYGDTQFGWILMVYNNCIDFTDGTFSSGNQIKYPSLEDLERIIFTLKARKRAYESELGEL